MKNNSIGTVAVSNTKRPRARFNLSADLHTSMDFGSVIPGRVHLQVPNSKVVCSSKERVLASPLLAPTMGRLSLKAYHNFVRLSDLTENFAPMLAQQAVYRGGSSFVPLQVPSMSVSDLSVFVLFGAYLNIWKLSTGTTDTDVTAVSTNVYSGTTGVVATDADLTALGLMTKQSAANYVLGIGQSFQLDTRLWIDPSSANPHYVPLGNPTNGTFYPVDASCQFYEDNKDWYDLSDVNPKNADYVIPVSLTGGDLFYLCFRLSDFGKRIRKILIGCGYQIDFTSSQVVSVLPLFAFYKSYFDVFGLTLYQNYESTNAYGFLRICDRIAQPVMSDFWTGNSWSASSTTARESFFLRFMLQELAACYYTDEQDFVSAHTRNTAVSPNAQSFINSINTDVDFNYSNVPNVGAAQTSPTEPSDLTTPNGHAMITDVLHGQLDSELLKRLYRWTNRNTIAGRRIAELLRAQGLGSFVDECKSDFIGYFELPIDVYDGISNSDTYSQVTDSGAPLGERFGNGQASSGDERNRHCERSFEFECNEFGYWVTLFTIVPKGGYAEAIDPTVTATTKFQFYQPEFDSLGMEFDPKNFVVGSMPFADFVSASGSLTDSFGLAPRFFRWKFGRNVANGDFTRRGVRDSFAPYYLDKVIDVGSRLVRPLAGTSGVKRFSMVKEFKPAMLPIAGNVWRYPTRYPFIGRFTRIFNRSFASREHGANLSSSSFAEFEVFSSSDDNFILHTIFDVQYFAPMLPVEESFETFDDDNAPNGSMSKA